jgi:hypothetical protein
MTMRAAGSRETVPASQTRSRLRSTGWTYPLAAVAAAVWLSLFIDRPAVAAEAEIYLLRISQVHAGADHAVTMVCSRAARPFCSKTFEIVTDGRLLNVRIVAVFSGYLYLKFLVGEQYLFVGSQPYAPILMGPSHLAHQTLELKAPPPAAREDSPNDVLHRLVLRSTSQYIATLNVDVALRPSGRID